MRICVAKIKKSDNTDRIAPVCIILLLFMKEGVTNEMDIICIRF